MFDLMKTKCVTPKSVRWEGPTTMVIDINDGAEEQVYTIMKGAEEFIHRQIDVKPATSKELFKKSPETWKQFRDEQLAKASDQPVEAQRFYLNKPTLLYLVTDTKELVDMIDFRTEEELEEFKVQHQNYILEITTVECTRKFFTDGKNGLVKLVCYDKNIDIAEEEYTPVVILELNNKKSNYEVYSGILIYKDFTFIPSISYDLHDKSLASFISYFNMSNYIKYATDRAQDLYEAYKTFQENPVEISAREMTHLCSKVGYKLELDDEAKLHPIEALSDVENNKRIQEFYNTFKNVTGETTYEILQLSDLRKTFRYNKLTLLEVLGILSKEYLTYDGSKITAEVLGDIVYKLMNNKNVDKLQVEYVRSDVNK